MGINSIDSDASEESKQSGQANALEAQEALATIALRCVECGTFYPGYETAPRYRCNCGGVLDVEIPFRLPTRPTTMANTESDVTSSAGAPWRQLFDERATTAPIW